MKVLVRSGAAVAGAVGLIVAIQAPASAHYTYVYKGKDVAVVAAGHLNMSVCNQSADDKYAMGYVILRNGNLAGVTDFSNNDKCENTTFGKKIKKFKLCKNKKCTRWKKA